MGRLKRLALVLLIPVVLVLNFPAICLANSPPPPAIFIIVPDAPKDLVLKIGSVDLSRKDKVFESYFILGFSQNIPTNPVLQVTTGGSFFEVTIPPVTKYSTTFTLDLRNKALTPGGYTIRPYEFAAVTVVLTILIEGAIFYLCGYRKRRSWIIFTVVNLLTQGFLYVMVNLQVYPSYYNYAAFDLIFGEFWVFVIEIIVFAGLLNEGRRWQTILYVIAANLVSLFAGGFIIGKLI